MERVLIEALFGKVNLCSIEWNRIEIGVNSISLVLSPKESTILSNNSLDKNKIFEQNAEVFYNAEQKYKINGMFLAAIGIHESGWGTSKIALEKGNLFGYKAYDSDPYNSASTFENYAEGINTVAEALATRYLYANGTQISDEIIARGTYFNGSTIQAVNTRYASDQGWYEKVYGYMQYLYNRL